MLLPATPRANTGPGVAATPATDAAPGNITPAMMCEGGARKAARTKARKRALARLSERATDEDKRVITKMMRNHEKIDE